MTTQLKNILFIFLLSISFVQAKDLASKISIKKIQYQETSAFIALEIKLKKNWKIYNDQIQEIGFPTQITLINSQNIKNHKINFPPATRLKEEGGFVSYGYKNYVLLAIKLEAIDKNKKIISSIKIKYALCEKVCIPKTDILSFSLEPDYYNQNNAYQLANFNKNKGNNKSLFFIIMIAIIAGFILNFMPCVLPVLMLKIFNFLEKSKKHKTEIKKASFATFLGILLSFWVIIFFIISFKKSGEILGWGMHFQQPLFILFLIIIITIFTANIFGYFVINIPAKWTKLSHIKNNFIKHFTSGILATILATPCSAPLLGTAIAFSFAASSFEIFLIFNGIAIGLGLPYLVLIIYPKLLYFLPKSGNWMNILKNILAFFLIVTILWLIWVLQNQTSVITAIIVIFFNLILFFLIKFYHKKISLILIIVNIIITFFIVANSHKITQRKSDNKFWLSYQNSMQIKDFINQKKVVFVNITANWCLTCKVNELFILNSKNLQKNFFDKNIIFIKADYTNNNPKISKLLNSVNRFAIPTYIVYSKKHQDGFVLRELLTQKYLYNSLKNAQN